jgi:protease I
MKKSKPLAVLADGGADVTLVSLRRDRIRGVHMHQPGVAGGGRRRCTTRAAEYLVRGRR